MDSNTTAGLTAGPMTGPDHPLRAIIATHGTLRLESISERFSTYHSVATGEMVPVEHGTGRLLVWFDDIDLGDEWTRWASTHMVNETEGFTGHLRSLLADPEWADEVKFCDDCGRPDLREDQTYVNSRLDKWVCSPCWDEDYGMCWSCETGFHRGDLMVMPDDCDWCDRCREREWSYCEDCDEDYRDDDGGHDHDEDESDRCEAPAQSFSIRNNGDGLLANDEQVTVTLPAGVISDVGIGLISGVIRTWAYENVFIHDVTDPEYAEASATYSTWCQLSYNLHQLGDEWQTKQGNYTKRLSRLAYSTYGLKVPPEVMSKVGTIGREHSGGVSHLIAVTRDLNQSAADFAHEDSCWWQSYAYSRCTLKTNGGFGLRAFHPSGWVEGRSWVLPMKLTDDGTRLTPTFETVAPAAFIVFNNYGTTEGYTGARIMAHLSGFTYRRIEFSCNPMYVNSDSGFLVAPEEIVERFSGLGIGLTLSQHSALFENERLEKEQRLTVAAEEMEMANA